MSEFVRLVEIGIAGIAAGFADSTVGGGGLITIPSLIFVGIPPQVAVATDKLGSLGQVIAALPQFWKAKKIRWEYVPFFVIISFFGSAIGVHILLSINPDVIEKVIGMLLLVMLPLLFWKRSMGLERTHTKLPKQIIGYALYFLLAIYRGFLGSGAGVLDAYNEMFFLGFSMIEVTATAIIPWIVICITSLYFFIQKGLVHYQAGFVLFAGMAVGGYIGSHIALRKGDAWVKRLFSIFVLLSVIKLLFF